MRRHGLTTSGLLVVGGTLVGLLAGYLAGRRFSEPGVRQGSHAVDASAPPAWRDLEEALRNFRRVWERSASGDDRGARGLRGPGNEGHREGPFSGRSQQDLLALYRDSLEKGRIWDAREALRALAENRGEALGADLLEELAAGLGTGDRELLRELGRTLVMAGGAEGLRRVLGFAEDASQSLERRRQALEGLSDLPSELAGEVIPALAAFLEKGPPLDLERTAIHAVGRLGQDRGVETLLGLLQAHPNIRAEAVFDAVGDLGAPASAPAVLGLLGGDWTAGARMSLLRSYARLTTRDGGDGSGLLALLREPPAGVSREMVARAVADSARDLGSGILRDALKESTGDRRAQEVLARSLLWSGGKEGLDLFLEAARSPEVGLDARLVARALTDFQGSAAVPIMLDLFQSSQDEEVLEPLARGLARNATREGMDGLLALLESSQSSSHRRAIARSLEEGNPASLGTERLLELLHQEVDQDVASSLARALGKIDPAELEGRAAELLQSASSPVERVAYAQLLDRASSPQVAELLGRQLDAETDSKARWELARILGRSGELGIQRLADSLHAAPDERSRHSLLWGLEASRRPASSEARALFVETAGADPSPSIRAQAAEILGRQQDPALIPVLTELLGQEQNREVRDRMDRALRELAGRAR